ncbi:DUF499 domain-containing protein [Thermorudis peleae]|uniref:DUF499 domain-containing protein n=1 Tax=Thermorudis peleae TaxID=1382356 RepID=UPI0005704C67|nr:DUF499 domain-containing protein [Thermorudis peleae]
MTTTLDALCVPRDWVFDPSVHDTVHDIDELDQLDPERFFAENYVTEGMRQLLSEAFKRLEGQTENASGIFLLSQSMGGGKTHNLLALGLLAKYPKWREPVMGSFYKPGPLGSVRVVAFSGRKTNTPYGIWGEIAEQLNRREVFRDFYSPLRAPGVENWVELLRGDPVLILLDELPPYFQAARAIQVGQTTLDQLTTVALANLLVAVASGKLPRVCVVLTDLRAQAYEAGSTAISEALRNLELEANRTATRIDPVRLNTAELYAILRQRLFKHLPGEAEIAKVADAYAQALEQARVLDLSALSPQAVRSELLSSYPFHPAIRDLFARFRENPGFQQTRALIRMMRIVVAQLWSTGAARHKFLVGAHDVDLSRSDMISEIRQINGALENAIAHDIVDERGGAVAQQIDAELGGSGARDAATLIFLSSLSLAVNPVLGLDRSEIFGYLAEPGRELTQVREALDHLQQYAWYLHTTTAGKLLFKNVENLNAKLESYASGLRDERELELRERLRGMFTPNLQTCYQVVEPLPALDQVQLSPDRVTLIIFRPLSTALAEVQRWWENQQYKNRVLFLTGTSAGYERVIERAAYLRAIRQIMEEFKQQNVPETDPQFIEARKIAEREESAFYLACRETFQNLYYPYRTGLVPVDLDPRYVANHYNGERQIIEALKAVEKFREDTDPNSVGFRQLLESRLWPEGQKEVLWSEIKRRAAADPGWVLHHPRALDHLKDALVQRDIWRDIGGGYIQRGPFPKPKTAVQIQRVSRDDNSGEVTLRVKPLHGDTVYYSFNGPPTTQATKLEGSQLTTCALRVWFLAVDSKGEHETGEPTCWTNDLEVKYRFYQQGEQRMCELRAIPEGEIRYTLDGSSPDRYGIHYDGPFPVPADTWVILAQATADELSSQVLQINVPIGPNTPSVDRHKAARWERRQRLDDTGATYRFLELVERHGARLCGVMAIVAREQRWVQLTADSQTEFTAAQLRDALEMLRQYLPNGLITLDVEAIWTETGQQLLDLVADLRTELKPEEVKQ